ncbi:class I SAM-dependent methyltransferase [Paenibacillus turpanensis]|uniref:class I SAM-dependent methyltransferase n=1 Tax=Paenibacillus turpanensis TaxID=2689078 RepID=UPI00140A6B21|nr:class I SAM-dependent methyltransferase [Paenibacillus turpanensis]
MSTFFTRWYDRFMGPLERGSFQHIRQRLLQAAKGKVLEVGSGTGVNFEWYSRVTVEEVTAIEPVDAMREQSLQRAAKAPVTIHLYNAGAEYLPFPDESFDTVVATLVMCTIPDPVQAMQEMYRVCKPGGRFLMFEHVQHEHRWLRFLQDALTPMWKRWCDGCHLNRDSIGLLGKGGFTIVREERLLGSLFVVVEAVKER